MLSGRLPNCVDESRSGGELELRGGRVEALEHSVEVIAGELPLEQPGDLLVAAPERQECLLEAVEVAEVVGRQHLALDDGEVDLRPGWRRAGDRECDQRSFLLPAGFAKIRCVGVLADCELV